MHTREIRSFTTLLPKQHCCPSKVQTLPSIDPLTAARAILSYITEEKREEKKETSQNGRVHSCITRASLVYMYVYTMNLRCCRRIVTNRSVVRVKTHLARIQRTVHSPQNVPLKYDTKSQLPACHGKTASRPLLAQQGNRACDNILFPRLPCDLYLLHNLEQFDILFGQFRHSLVVWCS